MKIKLVNFGITLENDVMASIETVQGCSVDIISIPVRLNLQKRIYIQIVDIVDKIPVDFLESQSLLINPPTLSIAGIYIVNEIYARTRHLPYIIELKRNRINGVMGKFEFSKIRDLQLEIMCTRNKLK